MRQDDVYVSGTCAYPGCKRPCVLEGYCKQHFDIVNQQKTTASLEATVRLLGSMNKRIERLEHLLMQNNASPIVADRATEKPAQVEVPTIPILERQTVENTPIVEEEKPFIPHVDIPEKQNVTIKPRRSHVTTKDVAGLAKKLGRSG